MGFDHARDQAKEKGWTWVEPIVAANVIAHESLFHTIADMNDLQGTDLTDYIDHNGLTQDLEKEEGKISPDVIQRIKDKLGLK